MTEHERQLWEAMQRSHAKMLREQYQRFGLPTEVPPEAIAMRVGQEMTDAVLRAFREQSELMKN